MLPTVDRSPGVLSLHHDFGGKRIPAKIVPGIVDQKIMVLAILLFWSSYTLKEVMRKEAMCNKGLVVAINISLL